MKAIRVATINNGNPDEAKILPRITLELLRAPTAGDELPYYWHCREYGEDEIGESYATVESAVRALYAMYNVPGWGLKTRHTDNRKWV